MTERSATDGGKKESKRESLPFFLLPANPSLPLTALLALRSVHINRRLRNDWGLVSHRKYTDIRRYDTDMTRVLIKNLRRRYDSDTLQICLTYDADELQFSRCMHDSDTILISLRNDSAMNQT